MWGMCGCVMYMWVGVCGCVCRWVGWVFVCDVFVCGCVCACVCVFNNNINISDVTIIIDIMMMMMMIRIFIIFQRQDNTYQSIWYVMLGQKMVRNGDMQLIHTHNQTCTQ